jgi:aerobic carbon-monoxide dehydrogenase medium subunit
MRKLKPFHYLQARSMEEALSLISKYGDEAKIVAGGTDLLLKMKNGEIAPTHLVDIKGLPELDSIEHKNDSIDIGALTRLNSLVQSPLPREGLDIISRAAETVGSYQIRNRATIGGNICNASPSADMVPALLCLDASVSIARPEATRTLPLEHFFIGPGKTVLSHQEILSGINIPKPRGRLSAVYLKHSVRNALDLAIVGVAVKIERDRGGSLTIRIALGGVAPTPVRAKRTENFLMREGLDTKHIREALEIVADELSPISDVRASAEYRVAMVQLLVKRGLGLCITGAQYSTHEVLHE